MNKTHIKLILFLTVLTGAYTAAYSRHRVTKRHSKNTIELEPAPVKNFTKKIAQLSFEEAKDAVHYYKALDKKPQVTQSLERMISLSTDHEVIDGLLLELAGTYFALLDYPQAETLYHQHAMLYPGGDQIEFVCYQQIAAAFNQILDASKDQTKTKHVIELADIFFTNFGTDNHYSQPIEEFKNQCHYRLIEDEANQAAFYLHKHSYTERPSTLLSARQRLIFAQENFLDKLSNPIAVELANEIKTMKEREKETIASEELQALTTKLQTIVDEQKWGPKAPQQKQVLARDKF